MGLSLSSHTTVLSAINATTVDCSFFAVGYSNLISAADSPFPTSEVQYLVLTDDGIRKTVVGIRYSAGYPQIATRGVFSGNWLDADWLYFSTATLPQEFDLPLAEGWSGTAKYFKTQENICFVELDIVKNATIQNGEVLATLPEGFRPSYLRIHPAITYSPHSSTTIGVSPTGGVLFGDVSGSPSARSIYATLVFAAAS